jgi:hypothetical protein
MSSTRIASAVALLVFLAPVAAQPKPDFSGEWVLNKEKTKLELLTLDRLEAGVLRIEHAEPLFKFHRVFTVDGRESEFAYDLTTDGREVTRQDGDRKLISKLYWEGAALVYHTRIVTPNGEATNIVKHRLVDGGRALESDERREGPDLKYHNLWVFDLRPSS